MVATYLVTGNCGTGKTWVVKQLIHALGLTQTGKVGLYQYVHNGRVALLGKYEGHIFDGSDRLSMSIMKDNALAIEALKDFIVIAEGDRFTNSTFINDFAPTIVFIDGTGNEGRVKRGSNQTDRHLKSINTRVLNTGYHIFTENSVDCFEYLLKTVLDPGNPFNNPNNLKRVTPQQNLFDI